MSDRYLNYYYNGKHYNSKWLAWESAMSDGLNLIQAQAATKATLGFDTTTFDNYDWSVEPIESWSEICRMRAQQIRDQYDHVALSYGGGSDCHHILDTFIRNKIKIDEIVINYDSLMKKDKQINYEPFKWAKETAALLPSTVKITAVTQEGLHNWHDQFTDDTIMNRGGMLVPDMLGVIQRMWTPKNDRSVLINGSWEPVVNRDHNGLFYIHLFDTDGFGTSFSVPNTVPFYTDPAFPEVHAKQCHIIKNFFQEHKILLDYSKDFEYYKDIIIKLTRTSDRLPLYKKSPYYLKVTNKGKAVHHDFVQHPKARAFYKSLSQSEPQAFANFHAIINQKFKGVPLIQHLKGVEIGKYYLE